MSRSRIRRGSICASLLVATLALSGQVAPSNALSYPANRTGVQAGSPPNGSGFLAMSLVNTADGRIRVTWKSPKPSTVRRFEVWVGMNRSMDAKLRKYKVSRKARSLTIPKAFGVSTSSGNYSFVEVHVRRTDGRFGSSQTKWIQAPITTAACAPGAEQVTVGTFNVRSWGADERATGYSPDWSVRGPRVINEIVRSGAPIVAIQEASGKPPSGFGPFSQIQYLLFHLNMQMLGTLWVDALTDADYKFQGLIGTRLLYDASRYEELSSGLANISPAGEQPAPTPWARLRPLGSAGEGFIVVSGHLATGTSANAYDVRRLQTVKLISLLDSLREAYGVQVILAADLNSTVNTKPYNGVQLELLKHGLYDSFATRQITGAKYGTTNNYEFPLRAAPSRRDYIMTLGGLKGSCSYVNQTYTSASQVASDHFMQVATLPLTTAAP